MAPVQNPRPAPPGWQSGHTLLLEDWMRSIPPRRTSASERAAVIARAARLASTPVLRRRAHGRRSR